MVRIEKALAEHYMLREDLNGYILMGNSMR
jgi:hypothetical protein